jgi:ATP-dependent Clp protease ATP-binding subunit ClpB
LLEGKIADGETVDIAVKNGELTVGGEQVLSEAAD